MKSLYRFKVAARGNNLLACARNNVDLDGELWPGRGGGKLHEFLSKPTSPKAPRDRLRIVTRGKTVTLII